MSVSMRDQRKAVGRRRGGLSSRVESTLRRQSIWESGEYSLTIIVSALAHTLCSMAGHSAVLTCMLARATRSAKRRKSLLSITDAPSATDSGSVRWPSVSTNMVSL